MIQTEFCASGKAHMISWYTLITQVLSVVMHLLEEEEVQLDRSIQQQWRQKDIEEKLIRLNVQPQGDRVA